MKYMTSKRQHLHSSFPVDSAFITPRTTTKSKRNLTPSFFPQGKTVIITKTPFPSTGQVNFDHVYNSRNLMESNLRLYARRGPSPPRGLNVGGTETSVLDLIGLYSQPILYFLLISAIMLSVEKFFSSRFGKGIVWKFFTSDELKAQKLEAEKRRKMKKLAALANTEAEKEDLSLSMPTTGGMNVQEKKQQQNSQTERGTITDEEKAALVEKLRKKKEMEAEMEAALIQSFKDQTENEEKNNSSSSISTPPTSSNKLLRKSESTANSLKEKNMEEEIDEDDEDDDDDDDEEQEDVESSEEPTLRGYRCEECYYTIYPAAGREFKFFPADFTCPSCGAPRDSFFDPNDPNDPRNWEEEEVEVNEDIDGDDGDNEYDFDIEDGDLDLDIDGDDGDDGDDFRL